LEQHESGAILHFESYDLQEAYPPKSNSILTGKQYDRFSYFSHGGFLRETHVFLNLPKYAFLDQTEPISTLKSVMC
jgi:hypothetical protein